MFFGTLADAPKGNNYFKNL